MPLTDKAIKSAKPRDKAWKLSDERGLYALINPTGSKLWRLKYRFEKKEKVLALGSYPDVTLKKARLGRDEARQMLSDGIDPAANRKAIKANQANKAGNSFEVIGREWFARMVGTWSEGHAIRVKRQLEQDLYPWLGSKPITEIEAPDVLACMRRIEDRGAQSSAHRIRTVAGQVFRYAIQTGRAKYDPSHHLKGALAPVQASHFAAITDPEKVKLLLHAIKNFKGSYQVLCALKITPLLFVRPGELRKAKWEQIDFENAEWRFFVTKTKINHIVPLSSQAIAILKELQPLTGNAEYLFPNKNSPRKPMSENTINGALRQIGITKEEMTAHGFRAMARTILDEVLGYRVDYIEHQLAHAVKDANGRAYNRTAFLKQRHEMMQAWSDYLEGLNNGV